MGLISWILVGGIAGWLSTKIITPKKRKGCFSGIILGIVGAIVGGFIVNFNNAKGEDVVSIIKHVQHKVKERFNVNLEVEQRII